MAVTLVLLVMLSCVLNTAGNTLFKSGLSAHPFDPTSLAGIVGAFLSWKIWLGMISYFASMLVFFYLLSRYKMSVVIPLSSITYILNLAVAFLLFKEKVSWPQVAGTVLILAGMVLLLRTEPGLETGGT